MTRTEIIQAAFETWGAVGYQATSLSALADTLGVTKTALYHHFKNKDDILGAMYDTFFDSMGDKLRPLFEKTIACIEDGASKADVFESILLVNNEITEFFVKNPWYFMFSLIKVHGNTDCRLNSSIQLRERGLDFEKMRQIEVYLGDKDRYPLLFQLVFACSLCIIAHFLEVLWTEGRLETGVCEITDKVNGFIRHGMGFRREKIDSLDWEALEKAAEWRETEGGGGGRRRRLIKVVASVVAAADPWAASMAMVAKKSGLSKSGLYAHFASKRDMLRQLFLEEFDGVIRYAQAVSKKSGVPEEQLYMAIRAVEGFLTSEPEFLAAIGSLKTRRINFDMDRIEDMHRDNGECLNKFSQVFSEIKDAEGEPLIDETTVGVILFLLTDTLIGKPDAMEYKAIPDESLRILYRFIALGMEGAK
ncbi:MAG: TetR/AcrR family transcriptional regulator; helix-turn-helix transcriptional regulator [Spirochaetaceae bacterium]|jgi:AcrR family transcriptional regulator|nr:TetR/AcrR family transcriptional regulator; helix-turn-helix transcriptional regulator [Spirochaetaceae bacterium]